MGSIETATPAAKQVIEMQDPHLMIDGTKDEVRNRFRGLLLVLSYHGYGRARVIAGTRSLNQQMLIYGKGRTEAQCLKNGVPKIYARPDGPIVTWCVPSKSRHVQGRAIDISFAAYTEMDWKRVGSIAASLKISWGGNWKVRDYGHFEI